MQTLFLLYILSLENTVGCVSSYTHDIPTNPWGMGMGVCAVGVEDAG